MSNSYAALCDDFYINTRLGTLMKLPHERASLINFFERLQKLFPNMTNFHQDPRNNESSIEEPRQGSSYRWLSVEANRLACGFLNPPSPADAYAYSRSILETVPFYLAISPIDLDYLDLLYGFDFTYKGNHHELIAEALLANSPMAKLMDVPNAKGIHFEVSSIIALNDDCRLHARVWIEPRTSIAQVRSNEFPEEMISLYVIIRQLAGGKKLPELHDVQDQLIEVGEHFINDHIIEPFVTPIREAIARRG